MSSVILSTRDTNGKYVKMAVTVAILTCLLGIAIMVAGFFLMGESDEGVLIICPLIGAVMILEGIFTGIIRKRIAESYADIYDERIVGTGIQNLSVLDFNFRFDQIINISTENANIYIYTNSGKYQIVSNKETAMSVFNYYHTNKKID